MKNQITKIKEQIEKRKQFLLYSIIGVSGAGIDALVFTLLVKLFATDNVIFKIMLIKILSTSLGITNNFLLNVIFNFKVKDNLMKRFISFYSIGFLGLGISLLIIFILVKIFGLDAIIVNLLTIIIVVVIQYNLNKNVSFKKN